MFHLFAELGAPGALELGLAAPPLGHEVHREEHGRQGRVVVRAQVPDRDKGATTKTSRKKKTKKKKKKTEEGDEI